MPANNDLDANKVLQRITAREAYDWERRLVPGALLADALRMASDSQIAGPIVVLNARISGNLAVAGIGQSGCRLTLQVLGCEIEQSFFARHSRWRQLVIARTSLQNVDLPSVEIERDLIVEEVRARGWLEMRDAEIGHSCAFSGSRFHSSERAAAVTLNDARIGRNVLALNIGAVGGFDAERMRAEGELVLDGAHLTGDVNGRALGLTQARIEGRVRLGDAHGRRFTSQGRVHLDSARVGALLMKGALVDGQGGPSIVGDQLAVREVVDLSGFEPGKGERFTSRGTVRLGSSVIGGQLQANLADFQGEENAIQLHGASIGGDLILGQHPAGTTLDGALNLNTAVIKGQLVVAQVSFSGAGDAISAKQLTVGNRVEIHEVIASGAVRFDSAKFGSLKLESIRIERDPPEVDRSNLPEVYAHPADALLDISFTEIASDIHIEDVSIRGGDCRMLSTKVGAAAQFSRIEILESHGPSLIAQSAQIAGGLQFSGSSDVPAQLDGGISAINLQVGEDLSFSHVTCGTAERLADVVVRSASVRSGIMLYEVSIHGGLNAGSAEVGGDFYIHRSRLLWPGGLALDLRGAKVPGTLQIASVGVDDMVDGEGKANCEIAGQVSLEGAQIGTLGWQGLRVGDGSQLIFSNVVISQRLSAEGLEADGEGILTLAGTTTPVLQDDIDDRRDGWGAGRIKLNLDEFKYGRLVHPSGRNSDDPEVVREWREKWFDRRVDGRSARPRRQLAAALREQGLFEASRLALVDAFSAEGRQRPTWLGRRVAQLFGVLFGHGLSGSRAAATLYWTWLFGISAVMYLQDRDLLVAAKPGEEAVVSCKASDPVLFATDAMLPLDLGVTAPCEIGKGSSAKVGTGIQMPQYHRTILGEVEIFRFMYKLYQLLSWVIVSLAILTWSGLLKGAGRD